MTLIYGLIWGSWIIFGLVAVWAFGWAIRSGQFRELSAQSKTIFDAEEPVGEMTDTFPDVDAADVPEPDTRDDDPRD